MKANFDKYLDYIDHICCSYLSIYASKINMLPFALKQFMLNFEKDKQILQKVVKTLHELFNHYKNKVEKTKVQNRRSDKSSSFCDTTIDVELEFDKYDDAGQEINIEVNIYLANGEEKGTKVLIFWGGRKKTLSNSFYCLNYLDMFWCYAPPCWY